MTDRQNEPERQTRKAWVAAWPDDLRDVPLYDSPDDVPAECTPRRVEVTEWEERGEPETWNGEGRPDAYQPRYVDRGGGLFHPGLSLLAPEEAGKWLKGALTGVLSGDTLMARTAIPVTIPTIQRREVRLIEEAEDESTPEPKGARERICRCGRPTPLVGWIFNCGECGYRGPPFEPRYDFRKADASTQPEGCREAIRRLEQELIGAEVRSSRSHLKYGLNRALAILRECCEDAGSAE